MKNYLDLVEEYPREPIMTQFEKVLMVSKRAKDLHNDDRAPYVEDDYKAPYLALAEMGAGALKLVYREEEPPPKLEKGAVDDGDDEDDDS